MTKKDNSNTNQPKPANESDSRPFWDSGKSLNRELPGGSRKDETISQSQMTPPRPTNNGSGDKK
ncbi:hypothetical protein ACS86_10190 [Vibrio alginolyticus]|nr:hypothetical protein ACS86_10190 [Vibrio alginolyticus]